MRKGTTISEEQGALSKMLDSVMEKVPLFCCISISWSFNQKIFLSNIFSFIFRLKEACLIVRCVRILQVSFECRLEGFFPYTLCYKYALFTVSC